jgi:CRP-like cAMP-binding protein
VEGVVEVIGRDEAGKEVNVCTFTTGDCVGELEFINRHECVADCKAQTVVRAARMHRDHFEMCMGPVTDVLLRNAMENEKYGYYRARSQSVKK